MIMRYLLLLCVCAAVAFCVRGKEVCCDNEVGCFDDKAPFDHLPLPKCPNKMGLTFRVYTRSHSSKRRSALMHRSLIPGIWNPDHETVFIVHGYMQGGTNTPWMRKMKDEFLMKDNYNVVIVGWGGGSRYINYYKPATNSRTVGAEIALIANNLLNIGGTSPDKLYCIGHSLGSHVCGFAGMRTQFRRITALDPAGPLFETVRHRGYSIGLNSTCAKHVDVIHTHGEPGFTFFLNLGTMEPRGDVDFYPNGGGRQPGCYVDVYGQMPDPYAEALEVTEEESDNGVLDDSETRMVASIGPDYLLRTIPGGEEGVSYSIANPPISPICSHMRAIDYYTESINNPNAFSSLHACMHTDIAFLPSSCTECTEHCPQMGFHAEDNMAAFSAQKLDLHSLFHLTTRRRSPFSKT